MELPVQKKYYPFRLSVPSFIYPADYVTNVKRLASCLDEVELLFFESNPDSLPNLSEIRNLAALKKKLDIGYNIHLPLDIHLGEADKQNRMQAVNVLANILELVSPLDATTHTLHLNIDGTDRQSEQTVRRWQEQIKQSLDRLFKTADIAENNISIETLDYSPFWLEPIIAEFDLRVCLDIGHVVRYGFDLPSVLDCFGPRTTMVHLHGVADGKDHLSLDRLNEHHLNLVQVYLKSFNESLSLEVFSLQRLIDSMTCLAGLMKNTQCRETG